MTRSKLVSLPVDAEGKPYATPEMIDTYHDAFVAEGSNPISRGLDAVLAALPEAVVVGTEDRQALDALLNERLMNPFQIRVVGDDLLAAGYRKTAILNRSRLIEEVAKALAPMPWDCLTDPEGRAPARSEATALLARVEDA